MSSTEGHLNLDLLTIDFYFLSNPTYEEGESVTSNELIYGQVGEYEKTIYDEPVFAAIERMCEKYSDRSAIIYLGESWTYAEMKELIDRLAKALYNLGVKHGGRRAKPFLDSRLRRN